MGGKACYFCGKPVVGQEDVRLKDTNNTTNKIYLCRKHLDQVSSTEPRGIYGIYKSDVKIKNTGKKKVKRL